MHRIAHLSDLHFGRTDSRLVEAVIEDVQAQAADLLVVSGDLTQRARTGEFQAARNFLDRLALPRVVVPGNHDVPLYDLLSRLLRPLDAYRRHVEPSLLPEHCDDGLAVFGISTARSLAVQRGRISAAQFEHLRRRVAGLPPEWVKILVTHHPCDLPEGHASRELAGHAEQMIPRLINLGFDLLLSGHLHHAHHRSTALRHSDANRTAVMVQAGTATSTRLRGAANSYNLLTITAQRLSVEQRVWQPAHAHFAAAQVQHYHRSAGGWE